MQDLKIFLWITAVVNPNGTKRLLANGFSTFFIWNGPKSLPNNPRDWAILDKWIFNNFRLADELLAKALMKSWNLCIS